MSIGEVLAHLRTEFPDTTISKLRFLEAEGLVDPQRTASGYRKYSWNDVARLRFVLTAQRDQYLPLRVIREQLDRMVDEPVARRPPIRPTPGCRARM
jgi:DNA-binding transcriptional MerR regulator